MSAKKHWTKNIFVNHPELFVPYLEEKRKDARAEALVLRKIFDDRGISRKGKLLDVCCGIGRHSVELAKLGYNIVGIDLAPLHIERARKLAALKKVRNARFLIGDMCKLYEAAKSFGKFNAAISMWTSFGYYSEKEDLALFKDMAKLCKKDGVLVLETMNRDWLIKYFMDTSIETMNDIEQHEFRKFNLETSFIENTWKFYKIKGKEREYLTTVEVIHRVYSAHELKKMLKDTGWKRVETYSGIGLEPLELSKLTNRLIVVAQR
jgi:ubiquinone/menaquinone biosynthesis C-methylase UbiE